MTAQILNGNRIAAQCRDQIADLTKQLLAAGGRAPGLAVVLVGEDPASDVYVSHKAKDCARVGFYSEGLQIRLLKKRACQRAIGHSANLHEGI